MREASKKIDWHAIQDLAKAHNQPIETLVALSRNNHPFYIGEARLRDAEWFAELYQEHGFGAGVHLRRIHYRLISQETPIQMPLGGDYVNTLECWKILGAASKSARYAALVEIEDFIDQRNPDADVRLPGVVEPPRIFTHSGALEIDIPDTVPEPDLWISAECPTPYHVEIWAEKSTVLDVLEPLAAGYGLNLQTSLGEISVTRCRELVERAAGNGGRPVRILYVSDFDPAGQSIPVATARKIEWFIRDGDSADIQLQPVVLTEDQCVEYRLPRTPIKEGEGRAARFEARFGEGATELDALEALRPGVLREILVGEIERFYNPDFANEWESARHAAQRRTGGIKREILARHGDQDSDLKQRLADLTHLADELAEDIAERNEAIEAEFLEAVPNANEFDFPELPEADEWNDPLFDSERDYVEQLDRYKEHLGKAIERKGRVVRACVRR